MANNMNHNQKNAIKYYSQSGEDVILEKLFSEIDTTNCFGVEFGASDGYWLSNLRMFINSGWQGLQMDGKDYPETKQEFITAENINDLFKKYNVPREFDLLSIDIDGNDYWVWKALNYTARVVVIEYNSNFPHDLSLALEYNPEHRFDQTYAYSASFKAMCTLAKQKGYNLYQEVAYTNLIFTRNDIHIDPIYKGVNLPCIKHRQKLKGKRFIEV